MNTELIMMLVLRLRTRMLFNLIMMLILRLRALRPRARVH